MLIRTSFTDARLKTIPSNTAIIIITLNSHFYFKLSSKCRHFIIFDVIPSTINVAYMYIVGLHQLTTPRNFQRSNDKKTIHVSNLKVLSIYKIHPLHRVSIKTVQTVCVRTSSNVHQF